MSSCNAAAMGLSQITDTKIEFPIANAWPAMVCDGGFVHVFFTKTHHSAPKLCDAAHRLDYENVAPQSTSKNCKQLPRDSLPGFVSLFLFRFTRGGWG